MISMLDNIVLSADKYINRLVSSGVLEKAGNGEFKRCEMNCIILILNE